MARSTKNTFAPINRIPPEVLSLIPEYCKTYEELVTLTHVCRSWRETFISRASLWTTLDCTNFEQTRVYLERSRASPLKIRVGKDSTASSDDAFLLMIPHISRLKTLVFYGVSSDTVELTEHLISPAPLLEKLKICISGHRPVVLESTTFGGNFSSLRELRLFGVLTDLPWKNMSNLTTFGFHQVPGKKVPITQLLDFFEHAPFLQDIKLEDSIPGFSNAPAERLVPLPHLKSLKIHAQPAHSILLNHLHIPTGAFVTLGFYFTSERSPILDHFPVSLDNFRNISQIISVNLRFGWRMDLRLKGLTGGLYVFGTCIDANLAPPFLDHRLLQSLGKFPISTAKRLTITRYDASTHPETEESGAYQTLLLMNNLHTLTLIECLNLSFIFALNPGCAASNAVVCPELKEVILYTQKQREESYIDELLEMVKQRGSRDARLSTITIICPQGLIPAEKVSVLREHVASVECRFDDELPRWDAVPGEVDEIEGFGNW